MQMLEWKLQPLLPQCPNPSTHPPTDCTELCLSGRAIERLHGFEPLVNLEALWLNGNALRCATGLDANTRLRELYLHVGALLSQSHTIKPYRHTSARRSHFRAKR
jgi:hypothetical protein